MKHKKPEAFGITKTSDGKLQVSTRAHQKFVRYNEAGTEFLLTRLDKNGALFTCTNTGEIMYEPLHTLSTAELNFATEQKILQTSSNVREFVITTLAV